MKVFTFTSLSGNMVSVYGENNIEMLDSRGTWAFVYPQSPLWTSLYNEYQSKLVANAFEIQ